MDPTRGEHPTVGTAAYGRAAIERHERVGVKKRRSSEHGSENESAACKPQAGKLRRECRVALVPFRGMHRFIPALVKGMGYKLTEIPVNHRPRIHGESKYKFGSRVIKATEDMFAVRWLLSRQLKYKVTEET